MANGEKITELIDDKALEQWEAFVASLDKATADMAKAADAAATLNKNVSKTKSPADFEKESAAAAKATEDLARKRAAAALAEERLMQAQMRTADMVERRAKKQAADEEREARLARTRKRTDIQWEINAAKELDVAKTSAYDANMKRAANEADMERARVANAAAQITAENEKQAAVRRTALAFDEQTAEVSELDVLMRKMSMSFEGAVEQNLKLRSELKQVQENLKQIRDMGGTPMQEIVTKEIELKAALQASNLEMSRATKERLSAAGSSDQLSVRLDRLRAAWRGMSDDERENTEVGKELEKQIKALDKELKTLDGRVGVHNRNVGNYKSGTEEITNMLTAQVPVLGRLKKEWESYTGMMSTTYRVLTDYIKGGSDLATSQTAAAAATGKGTIALRLFRLALISTGIGAIVVVLGSLIAYLSSTAEGVDKVTRFVRPLQAIMQALLGVLQNVGKSLIEAFTNPRQAMRELSDFLSSTIIPRLQDTWDILAGIATFDLSRIKSGFTGIGQAMVDTSRDISTFFANGYKTGLQIADLQKTIREGARELTRNESALNRTYQEQSEIARDMSKSEAVRRKAAEAGLAAANDLTKSQIALQEQRIALLKLENVNTQESHKYLDDLAEAEAKLDDIRASGAQKRLSLTRALNSATRQGVSDANKAQREAEKQARIFADLTEQQFELTMQLIQVEEDRAGRLAVNLKRTADDERNTNAERLQSLQDYLLAKDNQISLAYDRELAQITKQTAKVSELMAVGREAEAAALMQTITSQIGALSEAENEERLTLKREGLEATLALTKEYLSAEQRANIAAIEKNAQDAAVALAQTFAAGQMSQAQYDLAKFKQAEATNRKLIELDIEAVEQLIEVNKLKGVGVAAEEQKLADLKIRLSKQAADAQVADAERVAEAEREITSLRSQLYQELGDLAVDLYMQRFDREEDQLKRETQQIDESLEREKKAIDESTASQEEKQMRTRALENKAQMERERLELRQRQNQAKRAQAEKAFALMQAVANTAVGVSRAFADYPFPFSGVVAGLVGALGAVEIATIASQRIPQFYVGTKSSPEGPAFVGEKGTELVRYPDGSTALTPNSATLTWLPKGSEVLTNRETQRHLAAQAMANDGGRMSVGLDIKPLEKQMRLTNKQLKKMQTGSARGTVLTKNGLLHVHKAGSKWGNYLKRNKL